jgi:dimethylamine monooxygenase subunit C
MSATAANLPDTGSNSTRVSTRIKSRPEYPPVVLRNGMQHQVFISQYDDHPDLASLFEAVGATAAEPRAIRHWLLVGDDALTQLTTTLADMPIATALYVGGDEAFLWDVHQILTRLGFEPEQIQLLSPIHLARRLFCTHCYTLMEGVTHTPHTCSGCGQLLLVRDHFSRLHGAYVGVAINAEDPDARFVAEELK